MTTSTERLPPLSEDYALSEEQVRAYRGDGHVHLRGVASRGEVAAFRPVILAALESVVSQHDAQGRIDDYGALFTQVTNAWRTSEGARRFVFARRFARIAAELMGADGVRLYHDQALVKPPGGAATPWHQDRYYWPLDTDMTVTMWMPLVDVSMEMGPMIFATGSHAVPVGRALPISAEVHQFLAGFIEEGGFALASGPVEAGNATFHSGRTLHSSHPNRSARAREVMTVIYFADGTRLLEPDSRHRQADLEVFLPGLAPGDLAASPLNPLLYRR